MLPPIQEGTQQLAAFPVTTRCSLLNLPQDVIHHILLHLGIESTRDCSLACKHLHVIIQNDGLWQQLYFRDFAHYPKQNDGQSFQQTYQSCHLCEFNLKKGRFTWRTIADLPGGQGQTSAFSMGDGRLCIEQLNGTITVQDLKTREGFTLLKGKGSNRFDNAMVIYKNQLFLSTIWGTINIYNLETKEYLGIIEIPRFRINKIALCDNKLILCTGARTIRTWNIDTKVFSDFTIKPLDSDICCMAVSKRKLFLGMSDGKIFVLDIETRSLLNTLAMGDRLITCLAVSEKELAASNNDGNITIWDIDKENCLYERTHAQFREINSLVVANGKLFSASSDHTIKIWNISTGDCLSTLTTHESDVLCVVDKKIFSGSYADRKIKVCDFSESYNAILANIAELFRAGDYEVRIVMAQFNALPADVKNPIYGEMYQLLKPFNNDYFGCGKDAFHGHYGLNSTRQQKAQAIENYLANKRNQGS